MAKTYKTSHLSVYDENGNKIPIPAVGTNADSTANGNTVTQVNQWKGKNWVALGTSITSEAQGKYVNPLAALSGMTVTNHGVPGCKMGSHILYYAQNSTALATAHVVTVEGSVNDYASASPLGQVGDTIPYLHTFSSPAWNNGGSDDGTFAGACYQVFKEVLENAPNAVVICLTDTIGREVTSTGAHYNREARNSLGLSQMDYNNMFKEVAEYMGVIVIDTANLSNITQERTRFYADHIHHSALGGGQFANAVWGKLKNIPLIQTGYYVICNLTDVTINNTSTSVEKNASYTARLTSENGIGSVTITMGGVDITSTAYSNGYINIPQVTGDVIITAVGVQPSITYEVDINEFGYVDGAVLSTDGTLKQSSTYSAFTSTNLITLPRTPTNGVIIHLSGINWGGNGNNLAVFYKNGVRVNATQLNINGETVTVGNNNEVTIDTRGSNVEPNIDGFKACGVGKGANVKITVTIL
jgi:hypothetical protein